jgi:molybdate transport system substrate-binding protein
MPRLPHPLLRLLGLVCLGLPVQAAEVNVAVAANFSAPMQAIAARFAEDSGHRAQLSFGSTGKFYTQIRSGAPFAVLLAADQRTPERLEHEGLAVADSRFTYATGTLVLWSRDGATVDAQGEVLRRGHFAHLAIADPRVAPYGAAAIETLGALGLLESLRPRLVQGTSIAQAYQFVATGNAELGFVALSQVIRDGRIGSGSAWIVPSALHAPLRQDAVLLAPGRDDAPAAALMAFLRGAVAQEIIRAWGYAP